jgi:cytoskeletal protein CcmA (bactofilin family)
MEVIFMLRMGRSPKVDSNEVQPHNVRQTQPPQPAQTQTSHAAQTPAAQTFEPSVRPAPTAAHAAPSAPRAVTESEALARDLRDGVVSGFVGSGTVVSGDAEFKGMLRIDGRFTGRVRSEKGSLIVSAGGMVDANIEVATAKINGAVNGDIIATERIEFGRAARVRGNIQTPALVIEEGAIFDGNCLMQRPEAASLKAQTAAVSSAANNSAQTKTAHAKPAQVTATQPPPPLTGAARAAATATAQKAMD